MSVSVFSATLFLPLLERFQLCIRGPAKNLSNVPQEKARPAQWALWLARYHPLTCRVEIKHGGDKQLGEDEMSARHPESPVSLELAAGKGCPESKLLDGSKGGSSSGCSEPGAPAERVSMPGAHLTQARLLRVPGNPLCLSAELPPGQITCVQVLKFFLPHFQ